MRKLVCLDLRHFKYYFIFLAFECQVASIQYYVVTNFSFHVVPCRLGFRPILFNQVYLNSIILEARTRNPV